MKKDWINATTTTPEVGRYLCVITEQTDLGLSRFVWNCSYNTNDGIWRDNLKPVTVTYYMPLPKLPK